jgi:hypothetical protein
MGQPDGSVNEHPFVVGAAMANRADHPLKRVTVGGLTRPVHAARDATHLFEF